MKDEFAPQSTKQLSAVVDIINPEAVAWVIAAEGSISIGTSNCKGHKYYYPRVEVSNTDKEFIDSFHYLVGYIGSADYAKTGRNPNHKVCYHWVITSISQCLGFLIAIREFLPIKHKQAELVIEYCHNSNLCPPYYVSAYILIVFIISEIRVLNKRGRVVL